MTEDLKHFGTDIVSRDLLKMLVKTGANWLAHALSVDVVTLSGPQAFLGFCLANNF